ncbi:hypothetical protein LTR17_016690 [Elasticomyces elasticus]|nr:hypothetical protein LTR17_016690 [Elasticomyces elasticus]
MASPPLTNTPTDIMFDIFDLLTVTDLCNFRLVCRWGKKQSFKSFASRGYKDLYVSNCSNSVCDLVDILGHNEDLAAYVKTFTVKQCQFCINQERGSRNDSYQACKPDARRGEHGIEVVAVQKGVASMKGKQAIKLGVEVITQYVIGGIWR